MSCGNNPFESSSAPRTQDQVGIIASCTTKAEAASIASSLGIKYRVINENRKLIEFIGIDEEELQEIRPNSKLTQNKLYQGVLISGAFSAQSIANYPFYGAHTAQYKTSTTSRYFSHLSQISADSITDQGEGSVIAVIDTGVYYNHPHLSPNILTNTSDLHGTSADGSDNDGNGYVDDYVGWDFYNGDAYPIDDNGHGTHVAGLAASTYMGVAPKAKILPIKVLGADGSGDLATIAAGIYYAIDRGADVINLSLGGTLGSQASAEVQALVAAIQSGHNQALLVAAAGNGGNDGVGDCNDSAPIYPANIQEDNVMAVAAVDANNEITSYSNYGGSTVHVAAPGGDTLTGGLNSTAIAYCSGPCSSTNTPYVSSMGTSMSTPLVSGLAALVKGKASNLTAAEIKDLIMENGNYQAQLDGIIKSSSVINVKNTLDATF